MIDTISQRIIALEKKVGIDAKSPLFAQLAFYYLETERAEDALRICDAGLANFPFYTTGHLIKGKALAAINMPAEARREFEFVYDFLPNNKTIKALIDQLPPAEEETIVAPREERYIAPPQPEIEAPEPTLQTDYIYTAPTPLQPTQPAEPDYYYIPPSETTTPPVIQQPEISYGISEPIIEETTPEPTYKPTTETSFFDAITQAPIISPPEQTFDFGFSKPTMESSFPSEEQTPILDFNFPQPQPAVYEPTIETPSPGFGGVEIKLPTFDFGLTAQPSTEDESFDNYSSRRKVELSGENSISLEAYFASETSMVNIPPPSPEPILPPPAPFIFGAQDRIQELANTLQNVGKITPISTQPTPPPTPVINFAQKETTTASEQDTPAGMGFVTPTLAEIYAKQGWFDDAIKAYRTLARNKPADRERFEKRITELEALKAKKG